jgi:hypothetical protein
MDLDADRTSAGDSPRAPNSPDLARRAHLAEESQIPLLPTSSSRSNSHRPRPDSCTSSRKARRPAPSPHRRTPSSSIADPGAALRRRRRGQGTKAPTAGRRLRTDAHTRSTYLPRAPRRHPKRRHREGAGAPETKPETSPPPPSKRRSSTHQTYLHTYSTRSQGSPPPHGARKATGGEGERRIRRQGPEHRRPRVAPLKTVTLSLRSNLL